MALVELQNVNYSCDSKGIIKDFSLTIPAGDFISVVGPSGSGKSTFLKLCSHLISPTSGVILFNHKSVFNYNPVELRKDIVYCFQTPYLFADTVMDNLAFPFQIRNRRPDIRMIEPLFADLNLDMDFLDMEVKNLSGGERQRIALIRALLFRPQVLLLDEITSALDVENTHIVEQAVNKINREGTSIVWVTHSPEQSRRNARKLLTMANGAIKSLEVLP